jgi:hypothetical protein
MECKDINADLAGPIFPCSASPVELCSAGTTASGLLKGAKEAVYRGLAPSAGMPGVEAPTTLSYSGTSIFHTKDGDITTSFVGVIDTITLVFTEISRVTGSVEYGDPPAKRRSP